MIQLFSLGDISILLFDLGLSLSDWGDRDSLEASISPIVF